MERYLYDKKLILGLNWSIGQVMALIRYIYGGNCIIVNQSNCTGDIQYEWFVDTGLLEPTFEAISKCTSTCTGARVYRSVS